MGNKIKEQHLDNELINSLRFKREKINFDDLSKDLNLVIKNVGSPSGSLYDDTELRDRVQILEKTTAKENAVNNNFVKKNDILAKEEIQKIVDDSARSVNNDLRKSIANCLDGTKNQIIDEAMLSKELQYKINARYNNLHDNKTIDGGNGGISESKFNSLKLVVNENSENILDLAERVNNAMSVNDKITMQMLSSDLQNEIKTKVTDGTLTINAFEANTKNQLTAAINSDASYLTTRVNSLETSINMPNRQRRVLFSNTVQETTSATGLPVWGDILDNYTIATLDKNLYKDIVTTIKSGNKRYKASNGIEIDIEDINNVVCLDSIEHDWYGRKDSAFTNITDKSPLHAFAGSFLYNKIANELYYICNEDRPIVIKGDVPSQFQEYTLSSDGKYTFSINDPYNRVAKVLVLDQITNSRTLGKWINSEGVITAAYTDTSITIFNDADTEQKIRIYYR